MTAEFSTPVFQKSIAGYTFSWPDLELVIELQRLNDEAKGEIGIYHHNGNGNELLKYSRISLLDSRGVNTFAKSLQADNNPAIDWQRVMTYVTAKTIQTLRDGIQIVNINEAPETKQVLWCLYPFLPLKEPTTIFGPGGKGKSVLADLFALTVHCGLHVPGLSYIHAPQRGNVLYLDWERDEQVHRQRITAIKDALGIMDEAQINYVKCDHPITAMIDALCKKVSELQISLVILDSQMAATAGMGGVKSDAEVSSEYHNCIRRFNCTTLTIDHTTKAGASDNSDTDSGPFGSVVKYNRATSVYRIESDQETESDTVTVQLKHTKFNLGRKQAARGIQIEFVNDADRLDRIRFNEYDLAESDKYRKTLPEWQIIQSILRSKPLECKDIAEQAKAQDPETKIDAGRAYRVMNQKPRIFVKVEGTKKWGLVHNSMNL